MASKMAIYQNKVHILKQSSIFSYKSGRRETELKSGRLPHKSVELTCMDVAQLPLVHVAKTLIKIVIIKDVKAIMFASKVNNYIYNIF